MTVTLQIYNANTQYIDVKSVDLLVLARNNFCLDFWTREWYRKQKCLWRKSWNSWITFVPFVRKTIIKMVLLLVIPLDIIQHHFLTILTLTVLLLQVFRCFPEIPNTSAGKINYILPCYHRTALLVLHFMHKLASRIYLWVHLCWCV